jgi:hypothetical protein
MYGQMSNHREGVMLETVIPYDFDPARDTILMEIPRGYGGGCTS